jgi:hypothetical protein
MMMATTTTVGAATAAAAAEGSISVQGEQLLVHGQPLLTHLHPDVVFKPDLNMNSGFLGASFPELNSRHVIPLGHLEYELMLPLSPLYISASVASMIFALCISLPLPIATSLIMYVVGIIYKFMAAEMGLCLTISSFWCME